MPLRTGGGSKRHPCSSARSPRNRSTEWIETALSRLARLQTLSHGWSRPARGSRAADCRRRADATLAVSALLSVRQPGLDVLAGGAAGVARRQQVDVDGSPLSDRAGVGAPVQQVRQGRHVVQRVAHACRRAETVMTATRARLRDPRAPGTPPSMQSPHQGQPASPCREPSGRPADRSFGASGRDARTARGTRPSSSPARSGRGVGSGGLGHRARRQLDRARSVALGTALSADRLDVPGHRLAGALQGAASRGTTPTR